MYNLRNIEAVLDVQEIRKQFPIFEQYPDLVYLDNAATTHKPRIVLDAEQDFYRSANANPYRSVYDLAAKATDLYQEARDTAASFLNAKRSEQVIFTKGATEAVNLVAQSYGLPNITANDHIVVSTMEHHSNLLPWRQLAKQTGATIRVVRITDNGELDLADFGRALELKPKIVALTHISNVLGTINPVELLTQWAHQQGAVVLIDGAQAAGHMTLDDLDMLKIDPDFYLFSGHKVYGPQGVGVLYIKENRLPEMEPYQVGGGMIAHVSSTETIFAEMPYYLEAGTPNVAGAAGLMEALTWYSQQDLIAWQQRERQLTAMLLDGLQHIVDTHNKKLSNKQIKLDILGRTERRSGVVSWTMSDAHPHDVATFLAHEQIAVRAGHHCAMPLMEFYQQSATLRASLAIYNSKQDIEKLLAALDKMCDWWYNL